MSKWIVPAVLIITFVFRYGYADDDQPEAVYNRLQTICEIHGNSADIVEDRTTTINNVRGREYGTLYFYESEYIELKRIEVIVLDPSGKELFKASKADFNKACGFGRDYQLYNDICYFYKEFAYPSYPYTVNVHVEQEIKSLFFWNGTYFQRDIPVEDFAYRIICPDDFEFDYKVYGFDVMPDSEISSAGKIYDWQIKDIPGRKNVSYLSDRYANDGRLVFMADKISLKDFKFDGISWSNIGKFYSDLAYDSYSSPGYVAGGNKIDRDFLSTIYDEVINNTRYVSVSLDIGGWQPHRFDFIEERGYGDCKDLSTLLISRLTDYDIRAFPCLALTRGQGITDTDFPNDAFNHVFVLALNGQDSIWMDPTCSKCPLGEIPYGDENINVLVVDGPYSAIRRSPRSMPGDNLIHKTAGVNLTAEGEMSLEITNTYNGHLARSYRNDIEESTLEEFRNGFTGIFPAGDRMFNIEDMTIENHRDIYSPLIIKCKAVRRKPIDHFRSAYYIPVDLFKNLVPGASLNLKNRTRAVNIGYPASYTYNVEYYLDPALPRDSIILPEDVTLESQFGRLECHYHIEGDTIRTELTREAFLYELEPEEFEEFENFRSNCKKASKAHIKLYSDK